MPRRGVRQGQDSGSTGIDIAVASEADVRHDLGVFPYPVESDAYDAIFCRNVIEHVPNVVKLMEEIHRAGRPGAEVFITTPHFSSVYSYQDPTHVRHLSWESLDYFTTNTRHSNFYTDRRFEMVSREMDFGKSFPFSTVARALFALSPRRYEKHFAFMFPANSLFFRLRVVEVGARVSSRSRTWLAIYARAFAHMATGGASGDAAAAHPPAAPLAARRHDPAGRRHREVAPPPSGSADRARDAARVRAALLAPPLGRRGGGLERARPREPRRRSGAWGLFDLALVNGDARYGWLARAMGARRVVAFAGDRPAYKSWAATDLLPMPGEPMSWSDLVATLVPGPPPPPYERGQWEAPDCRPYDRPDRPLRRPARGRELDAQDVDAGALGSVAAALEARGLACCWSAGPGEEALVAAIPATPANARTRGSSISRNSGTSSRARASW